MFLGVCKKLFCCCSRCCNCCGENVSGDRDGLIKNGEEMQDCSTSNRNESGHDESERNASGNKEVYDLNKKIEERQKPFEEEQQNENKAFETEMEEKRRNRELLDEENDIRMRSSGPRIAECVESNNSVPAKPSIVTEFEKAVEVLQEKDNTEITSGNFTEEKTTDQAQIEEFEAELRRLRKMGSRLSVYYESDVPDFTENIVYFKCPNISGVDEEDRNNFYNKTLVEVISNGRIELDQSETENQKDNEIDDEEEKIGTENVEAEKAEENKTTIVVQKNGPIEMGVELTEESNIEPEKSNKKEKTDTRMDDVEADEENVDPHLAHSDQQEPDEFEEFDKLLASKIEKGKEIHEEEMKRIRQTRKEFEEETERIRLKELQEIRAMMFAFSECIRLKLNWEIKEDEWGSLLKRLKASVSRTKNQFIWFSDSMKSLGDFDAEDTKKEELSNLHSQTFSTYDTLYEAYLFIKMLSTEFQDRKFLVVLQKRLSDVCQCILSALLEIDNAMTNQNYLESLKEKFSKFDSSDIFYTSKLREMEKNFVEETYQNIVDPEKYIPKSEVVIDQMSDSNEAQPGNVEEIDMQDCSTSNRNESGHDESERNASGNKEVYDLNKKIEERQKPFEEEQQNENKAFETEMEEKRRNRELLDKENDIRMRSSGPRIAEVKRIVQENSIVLFVLSYAHKENDFILTVFNKMKRNFEAIYVEEDDQIRLGVKEYTGKERFPLLFINGQLRDINDFKQGTSNKL
ncbi:hypothetical protein L5515_008820 [Caenorhabditis briggsae]|uniref:Glutaredoxin domain-containing protein n=1 Tax=Caenorhabditis briggsae TaxID=6238 RepID=A0AAE9F888_CAEBR|nr:hypothetical protein L5515_008820 [Caenorhabditis briggsae]